MTPFFLALGSTFLILLTLFLVAALLYVVSFFRPSILISIEKAHVLDFLICGLLLEVLYVLMRSQRARIHQGLLVFSELDKAMTHVFASGIRIKQVRVFAHSTDAYYNMLRYGLKDSPVIESTSVLVRDPNSTGFLSHIEDPEMVNIERQQIRSKINKWKSAVGSFSKELHLYHYEFEPSFNLCIFNDTLVVLEMFKPCQKSWGFRTDRSYVIAGSELELRDLVQDISEWYDAIISEKSTQVF